MEVRDGHGHGGGPRPAPTTRARSTTHLTVADRWGNVVTYTFTIEQIGGSGIVVPGRGFLLNNELTDFNFADPDTANSPAPGKRPRSSMAPTIVFDHGQPAVALGSPGGSTIITTVLQMLVNQHRLRDEPAGGDRGAARVAAQQRDDAEPSPRSSPLRRLLQGTEDGHCGHARCDAGARRASARRPASASCADGRQQAVAEPTRRGGGSAMVVNQPG